MELRDESPRPTRPLIVAGVGFIIPTILYLVLPLFTPLPEEVRHFLLTVSAVMGVHFLDRAYLNSEFQAYLDRLKDGILESVNRVRKEIEDQTAALVGASTTLETMRRCGLAKIYPGRGQASTDIKKDLLNPRNTIIRIIGISLNDFAQGHEPSLKEAWKCIADMVSKPSASRGRKLDIKILMIDPDCLGAQLRSHGEARTFEPDAGRLRKDVIQTAEVLLKLESLASNNGASSDVSIECRFYRLPPILFLCLVDSCCYVQQYHFWSSRDETPLVPLLKYEKREDDNLERIADMHRSMRDHFDWVWSNASVPLREHLVQHEIGTDKALSQCGAVNIFTDSQEAGKRICYLLTYAQRRVLIQGNSLRSFFSTGPLLEALDALIERGNVDVDVLLLDPNSDQATIRSYREYLLAIKDISLDQYRDSDFHRRSTLYKDTEATVDAICDLKARYPHSPFRARYYCSAPSQFMLLVDDRVLVEHYNYGKVARPGRPAVILGKDMPLVEYTSKPAEVYEADPLRNPFALMEDHFRFVFDKEGREIDCPPRET